MRTEYFWPSVRRDLERVERSRTLHPQKKKEKFRILFRNKNPRPDKTKKKKFPEKKSKPQYPCANKHYKHYKHNYVHIYNSGIDLKANIQTGNRLKSNH